MKYDWIFFDADETLFHFDAFQGLKTLFSQYEIDFTEADYLEYQTVNKPLWVQYQNGEINAHQLKTTRFIPWAKKLDTTPETLNSQFIEAMAQICQPLDGAKALLDSLKGKAKVGIITNGFTDLQQIRLERTGIKPYIDSLIISEEVGIAKPDKRIFDYAFEQAGNPQQDKVLMVGDTLLSDVLGGVNAGVDTCWLNPNQLPTTDNVQPTYTVQTLSELQQLLA